MFLFFANSYDKEDDNNNGQENVPELTTTAVTEITANTATSDGNITDDGGTTVTGGGTFTDPRDGKVYQTVIIGNQEWMAKNLAYKPSSGNYWAYDNNNENVETYGYLYDWQNALNVCPTGWHLPSNAEWTELTDYLGSESVAGGKLKATGTIEAETGLWYEPNTGATNETGFTTLPGGYRGGSGTFGSIGDHAYWWSATGNYANDAWSRFMFYNYSSVGRLIFSKEVGFSVRCVRD